MAIEQIKKLENRVVLAGALAELDKMYEGNTKDGIPYLSFKGKIQCGADKNMTIGFKTFLKSIKADGTVSKNFANVKKWYNSAVPMTQSPENPTMVEMFGSVTDNAFVSNQGKLVEATVFNIVSFKDFTDYKAQVDLEGIIYEVGPEIKKTADEQEVYTGRGVINLISRDFFGKVMQLPSLKIPKEYVNIMDSQGYIKGATATFFMDLFAVEAEVTPSVGGFGNQHRFTSGRSYMEWVICGATPIATADSRIDPAMIPTLLNTRRQQLEQVKLEAANRPIGNASVDRSGFGSNTTSGFGNTMNRPTFNPEADTDFPF